MKVRAAVARVLKQEGVECLFGYPRNPVIESAAEADIRTIIVRQERTGVHMADALSRVTCGDKVGVFAMQHGPGTENAFGGVAQAFADSVPLVVLPAGYSRDVGNIFPNFSALQNFDKVTKWLEQPTLGRVVPDALRRAFTQAKNGRPGPTMVELPTDLLDEDMPDFADHRPTRRLRSSPDATAVSEVAEALVAARVPVIYAGQGIHYAKAWPQLKALAEMLEAPVCTSLAGKSAFPENHPLALGSGGVTYSKQLAHFLAKADVIFGIGCSFTSTGFGIAMPAGKSYIHATLDPIDIDKDLRSDLSLVGDAALTLDMLCAEVADRLKAAGRAPTGETAKELARVKQEWLAEWAGALNSESRPLSPYRVVRDLMNTLDPARCIVTHDAGSPRNQIVPFWESPEPMTYIGWGKSTQLGYGLGLAMGAKLARPDMMCVNVWGDAAIGFTGMDLETAAREGLPILSILFNNSTMAIEHRWMPAATEKYRSTDVSGDYTMFARSMGCWAERVEEPGQIVPAIQRAVRAIEEGKPALLEFITEYSSPASMYR